MRRLVAVDGVCLSLSLCGVIGCANCGFPRSVSYGAGVYSQEADHERLPSSSPNPHWVGFFQYEQWTVPIGFGGLFASLCFLFNKPERRIEMTREEKLEAIRRLWDKDQ